MFYFYKGLKTFNIQYLTTNTKGISHLRGVLLCISHLGIFLIYKAKFFSWSVRGWLLIELSP